MSSVENPTSSKEDPTVQLLGLCTRKPFTVSL